jgi:uncharacterized protein YjbI with pentapeptide repeats
MTILAVTSGVVGLRAIGSLVVVASGLTQLRNRRRARPADTGPRHTTGLQLARRRVAQRDVDGRDLRQANLRRARLRDLDLAGCDLTGADLTSARLDGSKLSGARLDGSDLSWASLRGCDLRQATLPGAQLLDADLRLALLHGTDLARTSALETVDWRGARADRSTRWPAAFNPRAAGVVVDRTTPP